ncbi:MAG: hypothetical protein ACK4Z6_06405 [Candidatus Methylomirabilales bacterium]
MATSRAFRWSFLITLALCLLATALLGAWWAQGRRLRAQVGDPEGLARAFLQAVEAIRHHQAGDGYWQTLYTPGPVFERPAPEVNVFVPALMVDLLDPVAQETGLTETLERAREYLRHQIEETGLVRYHGRPDQPYLPQFGCVITPDADDTALVWRVAPTDDHTLLHSALRALRQYRTDEGLYRTWLASRDAYRCIDPGHDPNPADVGIQMHLYLFFARYDLRSARRLCDALRQRISDDRIWVYYKLAPLVPLLREGNLSSAGCPLRMPESRFRQVAPGQEGYLTLSQLFRDLLLNQDPAPSLETVLQALKPLAEGAFMGLERTPPLLFHNDFSASNPRFYWSVDVGYALWLRVYIEVARRWPGSLPLPTGSAKTP